MGEPNRWDYIRWAYWTAASKVYHWAKPAGERWFVWDIRRWVQRRKECQ